MPFLRRRRVILRGAVLTLAWLMANGLQMLQLSYCLLSRDVFVMVGFCYPCGWAAGPRNALVLLVWLGMLILCRLLWAVITLFPHGLQIAFVRASIGFGVRSHARRSAYGRTVWFSQRSNLIHHGKSKLRPKEYGWRIGTRHIMQKPTCSRSSPGLCARPCWVRLLRFTYYKERGPHDY